MKTLLTTALLLFAVNISAQKIVSIGTSGAFWSDSLTNAIYVPDTVFVIDGADTTSWSIDTVAARNTSEMHLGFDYELWTLTIIDTGATYDDSIMVEYADIDFVGANSNSGIDTTFWRPIPYVRDSTWTDVSGILVDDNAVKTYTIWVTGFYKVRVRTVNVEAVENKITKIRSQLSRKRF